MNKQVKIRPITEADTDNIIKWRNNPAVSNNFIYRSTFTKESHLNWYNNKIKTGEVVQFIISYENADVGSVYIRDIDMNNKKGEFGIFLGEERFFGKGIGTSATKLILDYAFNELNLNKVYLRVFTKNLGAIKSYEKAGFKQDGIFREDVIINSIPYDIMFMSMLKNEYNVIKAVK